MIENIRFIICIAMAISYLGPYFQKGEFKLVSIIFQAVTRVLTCQPKNAKALYRKSRILSSMGRNSEALEAARAAAAAAPEDAGARKELLRCEQRATRERSVERKLAKRMLGTNQPKGATPDKKPSRAKV